MARLSVSLVSICYLAAVSGAYVQQYYQQPEVFADPIPVVAEPLYAKAEPIIEEESIEDGGDSLEHEDYGGKDYDGNDDHDSHEEEDVSDGNGDGNVYGDAHHSGHDDVDEEGHKSQQGFQKGESGGHDANFKKGFYHKGAGNGGKHYDEADGYGENHGTSKGHKGEDFGNKNSHSKGGEVTGFHKVYRNDDFKKDHVFYDKADNSGHNNKHASGDSRHHSTAGGHKKGGHYDSAHKEGGFEKAGHSGHGGHHDADKSYVGKGGDERYNGHHEDYAEKGGHAEGKEYGHGDVHGH